MLVRQSTTVPNTSNVSALIEVGSKAMSGVGTIAATEVSSGPGRLHPSSRVERMDPEGKSFHCRRGVEWPALTARAILSVVVADFADRVPAERRAALLAALARSIAASLDLDTILQTVAEG